MRKSTFYLATLLLFALPLISNSQSFICGTPPADLKEIKRQMMQNREDMQDFIHDRSAVTYVPVRFFLVAKNDGSGRPSERLGLRALCIINEKYADQDIQFYLKEFKYINNTNIYSNPMSFAGSNAIANQVIYNALNVFIVNDAGGGAAAYYQPPAGPSGNDWIVSSAGYVDDVSTLAHEIGHFFSLPHTFYGWEEAGGWSPTYGNPVGLFSPDGTPNEFVDGTNCNTAGDGICDTPADYMYDVPNNNCQYSGNLKDPHGDLISPDPKNMMNYYFNCIEYYFTDGQKDEIQNSLFHGTRNYVRPNYTPNLTPVTQTPSQTSPAANETVETYNYVVLDWEAVPGADHYIVEISSAAGTDRYIITQDYLVVTSLEPSKGYLWKVMAYNEYSTCGNFSSQRIVKTGDLFSDTSDAPKTEKWTVNPNPVRGNGVIYIDVESVNGFEANISLLTLTGQTVKTIDNYQFPNGISTLEIPVNNLPSGMYLVAIQGKAGLETRRIAITD